MAVGFPFYPGNIAIPVYEGLVYHNVPEWIAQGFYWPMLAVCLLTPIVTTALLWALAQDVARHNNTTTSPGQQLGVIVLTSFIASHVPLINLVPSLLATCVFLPLMLVGLFLGPTLGLLLGIIGSVLTPFGAIIVLGGAALLVGSSIKDHVQNMTPREATSAAVLAVAVVFAANVICAAGFWWALGAPLSPYVMFETFSDWGERVLSRIESTGADAVVFFFFWIGLKLLPLVGVVSLFAAPALSVAAYNNRTKLEQNFNRIVSNTRLPAIKY